MSLDDSLRRRREEICVAHLTAENAHEFQHAIDFFEHPRYEIVATGEVYDGGAQVGTV